MKEELVVYNHCSSFISNEALMDFTFFFSWLFREYEAISQTIEGRFLGMLAVR